MITQAITEEARNKILNSVGEYKPESGGVIACSDEGIIVDFYFDTEAGTGQASYKPSIEAINQQVNCTWAKLGCHFRGMVHSHPIHGNSDLSNSDVDMAKKIMLHNNLPSMLLIVVHSKNLFAWEVFCDENESRSQIEARKLEVI
ncbi:MAG: hypothetical protein IJP86_10530 [Synergistaceae bacterium]|nr:hypothetical protein [Synergistaceae bacterium]